MEPETQTAEFPYIQDRYARFCVTIAKQAAEADRQQYTESEELLDKFVKLFRNIGTNLLLAHEDRSFEIDDGNSDIIRALIAYQLKWEATFLEYYHRAGGKGGNIYNPIMLIGAKGTGKTILFDVASWFASITGLHSRSFVSTSASELLNHFRVHGNIDKYTYNIEGDGKPFNVCFNDLGVERDEKSNSYGTSVTSVVRDFLLARYEIAQNLGGLCHITTNLSVKDVVASYPERVVDRLKQYNVFQLRGTSRRRN